MLSDIPSRFMYSSSQMDRLSALLQHFNIKTKVFGYGTLCGESTFDIYEGLGHIHVIKKAPLEIFYPDRESTLVSEPSLIFFAKPIAHSFRTLAEGGAEMVCATVSLGSGFQNPLNMGFPSCLVIPLSELADLEKIFDLLYYEAFESFSGKKEAIDHLMDYLVIRMYRYAIQEDIIESSAIAGLADKKISKSLFSIHENPEKNWCLDTLSDVAGMSRARFAKAFKDKVGVSPMSYLADWRLSLAMKHLTSGIPIKNLHKELGYSSASSFTRIFQQRIGMSPKEWMAHHGQSN